MRRRQRRGRGERRRGPRGSSRARKKKGRRAPRSLASRGTSSRGPLHGGRGDEGDRAEDRAGGSWCYWGSDRGRGMNTHGGDGEGEGGAEEGEVEGGGDVRGGENLLGHSRHDLGGARLGGGHHGTWGGRSGREMGWLSDRRERGGYLDRARVGRDRAAGAAGDRVGASDRRSRRCRGAKFTSHGADGREDRARRRWPRGAPRTTSGGS